MTENKINQIIEQLVVQQEEGEITKGDLQFLVREVKRELLTEVILNKDNDKLDLLIDAKIKEINS